MMSRWLWGRCLAPPSRFEQGARPLLGYAAQMGGRCVRRALEELFEHYCDLEDSLTRRSQRRPVARNIQFPITPIESACHEAVALLRGIGYPSNSSTRKAILGESVSRSSKSARIPGSTRSAQGS